MIPLKDDNPTRTFPYITITLIVLNVVVFLYELTLMQNGTFEPFLRTNALIPADLTGPVPHTAYASVFSSMFLHGGLMHLLGNMLYLWIFGNNIEDSVGHVKYVFFYLLCGVGAALAQTAMNPHSLVPMIGASGAISGVLGAYLLLFPRARVLVLVPIFIIVRIIYLPALVLLAFWFVMQLVSGWATAGYAEKGGVAFWAHGGGFIAGMVLIPFFKRRGVKLFQ